jgi:glycosyltransferase involved in cell wall biosynthesis
MLPSISVVTPSFNQGRFIERTIQSVLSQEILDLEHVVIDAGSTDQTLSVLRRYEKRLHWTSEKDKGQADAVNKGIKATRGPIIGWLNSDDIYYPNAISEVLTFFDKHPEKDVVYGNADHIDINDSVIEPYYTEDWDYNRLKEICFICQPAVLFRRRLIDKMGFLDDNLKYCMDYEYWLRLGTTTPFVHLNKKLAGSRMYEENKTLGARVAVHREICYMLRKKFKRVPDKWIYAYAHALVDAKRYDQTTQNKNLGYVLTLTGVTLFSFLRWNQRISVSVIREIGGWLTGSLKGFVRR